MRAHLMETAARFLAWSKRKDVQRVGFAVAALLFVAGIYVSLQSVALTADALIYHYLVMILVMAVPGIIITNIFELHTAARLVGAEMSLMTSARISVLSSAANLLPIPAGPIMRAVAVAESGGAAKGGAVAVLFPAAAWLAIGLALSAGALLVLGAALAGAAAALASLSLGGICVWLVRRANLQPGAAVQIFLIKLAGAVLDTLAIYWVLAFSGEAASLLQALGLAASAPLGAAVSVVPAGLGVRELASSALGLLVGLTAAQAFLAPSVFRILYLVGLAAICPFFIFSGAKKR